MKVPSHQKLARQLLPGRVYRRGDLLPFTKAVDRDLHKLLGQNLEKVGQGLYHYPRQSRFGKLPANEQVLVKAFLRDDRFLLFSQNEYNKLGLGLTQLYNNHVVYNYKRHGKFKLDGKTYDFRRLTTGFPNKLTREFLLVDLLNNLKSLDEDPQQIKQQVQTKLNEFDPKKLMQIAKLYGKLATKRFLAEYLND